ncbi:hypothetical protein EV356DRAFT_568024 [Viridothelium virens]|uniref:Rhodopsin domain-containing protein n=1 Tax=Viridothelium virens TaxID=1048519 RepID=A0A6A6H5J2_VIRVR|nr:hypothetical protein EV356DRAFT_568024 [Viridothelium virens]
MNLAANNYRGRTLIIILAVFLILDLLAVGIRIWARRLTSKSLELNDWAIIAGTIFIVGEVASEVAVVVAGGVGLHAQDIYLYHGGTATLETAGLLAFVADIIWNLAIGAIKVSILHLYLVIFGRQQRQFRLLVYGMMALCLVCMTAFILEEFLICRPLRFYWNKQIDGKCGNEQLAYLIPGVINTALDLVIFAMPLPILWNLNMPLRKKISTAGIFSVGLGICLVAGVRLKYVLEIDYNDFTYTIWYFAILGPLEPMLGIISACLPMLPPVFSKLSNGRIMAWTRRSVTGSGGATKAKQQPGSSLSTTRTYLPGDHLSKISNRSIDHEVPLIDRPPVAAKSYERINDEAPADSEPMIADRGKITVTRRYQVDHSSGSL